MPKNKQRKDEREMTDRAEQAVESGAQDETGRSRGHIINEDGTSASGRAARKSANEPDKSEGQHWESGRQSAVE
jgi:hypothetical protein